MNRVLALVTVATLALSVGAAAQATTQVGPESTNNNRNAPSTTNPIPSANPTSPASSAPTNTTQPPRAASQDTVTAPSSKAGANATTGASPAGTASAAPSDKTGSSGTSTGANAPQSGAAQASGATNANKDAASDPNQSSPQTQEPKSPRTELFGTPGSSQKSADPLLEPPPLPPNKSTLVGGIARKVDRISNRLVIQPFGGGKSVKVTFDERSHIYRDGRETTVMGIREGDRVYADTMLVNAKIFARNIRVQTTSGPAEASGQVTAYDQKTQTATIVDKLTGQAVAVKVTPNTMLKSNTGEAKTAELRPGALVSVLFEPGRKSGSAREITVLAQPGGSYIFAGRITNLDLRNGLIAVDNQSDGRNYELRFDPAQVENREQLVIGAEIAANSTFDGRGYSARSITVTAPSGQNQAAEQ